MSGPGHHGDLFVFDLFGTLLLPAPLPTEQQLLVSAEQVGIHSADASAFVRRIVEDITLLWTDPTAPDLATVNIVMRAAAGVGLQLEPKVCEALLWHVLVRGQPPYRLADDALALVEGLSRRGDTVRLLSNCLLPGRLMWQLLGGLGLGPPVVREAVFSSDGDVRKPQEAAFEKIGRGRFRMRWMIGDSEQEDIEPAAALGWRTRLVDRSRLPTIDELTVPAAHG